MLKEIRYTGCTAATSDYTCPDGELTTAVNLINEHGTLTPICAPAVICPKFHAGHSLQYIHRLTGSDRQLYICLCDSDNSLYYSDADTPADTRLLYNLDANSLLQITAIGNTLVLLTSAGMIHCLWKAETQSYVVMPAAIPELPMSFRLCGDECRGAVTVKLDSKLPDTHTPFSTENSARISDTVIGHINSIITSAAQQGRFIFPFFARFALRLFDGSLVNHSAPVLMRPMIGPAFVACMVYPTDGTDRLTYIQYPLVKLKWQITGIASVADAAISALKPYADIISSIDIFVSAPLYDFDINGSIDKFSVSPITRYNTFHYDGTAPGHVTEYSAIDGMQKSESVPGNPLQLPALDDDDSLVSRAAATANYYLVKSIPFADIERLKYISTDDIDPDILPSLLTRETMTDDYGAGDTLVPAHAYVYNSRLNIANITKVIPSRTDISLALQYIGSTNPTEAMAYYLAQAFVFVRRDDRVFTVASGIFQLRQADQLSWFYHHCPGAYRLLVVRRLSTSPDWQQCIDLPLRTHDLLNGAYYCHPTLDTLMKWSDITDLSIIPTNVDEYITEATHNKIYTSEVNNPFTFPVTSVTTVGSGSILALSSAAKALSTGQFGQFPLYAFTSEGIWALEVSSTGTYSARQPITRDVCLNPAGIAQLDSSVAFPSHRGIMLLTGSQVQCLSDSLDSETPFDVLSLPHMADLHGIAGHRADSCIPMLPLSAFLATCRILYDYVHQRLIVFNPAGTPTIEGPQRSYALVLSLRTQQWGMMQCAITHTVNSYPMAYAVTDTNRLVDFSADTADTPAAILVTRPLKLDAPDILKTIDTVIQRGNFARGHVASVLYGSRDLHSWHTIWSSSDHTLRGFRGTPYKYFRLALICRLAPGETLSGCTIQYMPRLTNQPR